MSSSADPPSNPPRCPPRRKEGDSALPSSSVGRQPRTVAPTLVLVSRSPSLVVVAKPFDMRIEGDFTVTVEKALVEEHGLCRGDLRLIHRLDYATSGVMAWALTREMARSMSQAFSNRLAWKAYLAVVRGHIGVDAAGAEGGGKRKRGEEAGCDEKAAAGWCTEGICQGDWGVPPEVASADTPVSAALLSAELPPVYAVCSGAIADDVADGFRMKVVGAAGEEGGRAAETAVRVLDRGWYRGQPVTKVMLQPRSGRRHQLRVHLLAAGHPIVGDATYTDDDSSPRMMLHAWVLCVPPMPTSGLSRRRRARMGGVLGAPGHSLFTAPDPFKVGDDGAAEGEAEVVVINTCVKMNEGV